MEVSCNTIKRATAAHYDVTVNDLEGPWRVRNIVRARQVAMVLARYMTRQSYPAIGRHFGGRHHTTVMYAVTSIEEKIRTDRQLGDDIESIAQSIADADEATVRDRLEPLAAHLAPLIAEKILAATKSAALPSDTIMAAVSNLATAFERCEQDRFGRGERFAHEALYKACKELRQAYQETDQC